jgi:N-methylhydantoinase A
MAFGGGGGLNAYALAKELSIKKIIIPKQSSVFSAWGMLLSDLRRDYVQTQIVDVKKESSAQLTAALKMLEEKAARQYAEENIEGSRVYFRRYARCRYQNQEHSVEILLPEGDITPDEINIITERFHEYYEREYTYRLAAPIELVCFHLIAIAEMDKLKPTKHPLTGRQIEETFKGKRKVDFVEFGLCEAVIYDGNRFEPGMNLRGPAIVEEAGATIVIPPDFRCAIDDYGNYLINLPEKGEEYGSPSI